MTSLAMENQRQAASGYDTSIGSIGNHWVRFWFSPVDPAPLGLLRLLVGGMVIYSHLVWGMELRSFLGPDGWNSDELIRELQKGQWNASFWWLLPVESMETFHRWCMVPLILFWIGCFTRVTSTLTFAIFVSYCQRAAIANYGLDQICGILLFSLAIGPSGATYSVDSLLRRSWIRRRMNPIPCAEIAAPSMSAGLALRLIQVHYCIIYFFAATGKLQGESWWNGHAVWRIIANYEYQSWDMVWLGQHPELIQLITHVVILWELSFAYLIWVRPLRPLMLVVGVLMHLGIGACLGMWTFGLAMIFGYVAFLSPETVRWIVRSLFSRPLRCSQM